MQESFQITERIAKNAFFSYLMKTEYGATYLSTILPLLTGNFTLIRGDTTP
jgi:hypothetical protein